MGRPFSLENLMHLLPPGLHDHVTVEHTMLVEGDGTTHVFIVDKYRKPFDDPDATEYATVEAALDAMFEATNTVAPRWPDAYIPRQARFLRALCDDPDDPTFASLHWGQGEEITLSEAADLFASVETDATEDDDPAMDGGNLGALATIKRLLDTDVKDLFHGHTNTRTDAGSDPRTAHEAGLEPNPRVETIEYLPGDDAPVLLAANDEVSPDDAIRNLESAAAARRAASEVGPDTPRDTQGLHASDLTLEPDRPHPRGWPESHRL